MKLHKELTNLEIAELLRDVAASYQLKDEKKYKFQIIAYQRAADAVEHATSELKDLWDDGKLNDVPGIGPSISSHLDEVFRTGKSKHFEEVMKGLPESMFEFMKVPGIGAKTGFRLANDLKLKNLSDLEEAAVSGKIAKLSGFGEDSQADILKSVQEERSRKHVVRHLLSYAVTVAGEVIDYMSKLSAVKRIDPLGSLRRQASTIGDIDIAVATDRPVEVLDYFTKYPKVQRVLEKGTISSSIIVPGGIHVDLMVQPVASYGSLLQHFTGSKHHNIALREYALKKGFSLSEKGIKVLKTNDVKKFKDEESFYEFLGLNYIPPELREDTGEIEAAKEHKLPNLIKLKDIKSDLQIHSSFDVQTSHDLGESSMEEIVKKGEKLGYEYLAFTEHNPSQKGHKESDFNDILQRKKEVIDNINYSIVKTVNKDENKSVNSIKKVFNSLEVDILPNGDLPVPDRALDLMDFVLVSIHSSFRLERGDQTKRVLSALEHPKAKIFAHPTGRKLNEREGVELDWPKIFEFCIKNHKWLEINCDPARLDLPDSLVREAVKIGMKFTFGTDAHNKDGMDNMVFGVSVARRGWCTPSDIINTRTLLEFEKLLK